MTENKTNELNKTNVQESADLARQQANKDVTNVDRDKSKKDGLEDKLMKIYDEFTDEDEDGELFDEILDACSGGDDVMEELKGLKLTALGI